MSDLIQFTAQHGAMEIIAVWPTDSRTMSLAASTVSRSVQGSASSRRAPEQSSGPCSVTRSSSWMVWRLAVSDLREALEALAERWSGMDTPGLSQPQNVPWAEGVDQGYANAAAELLGTLNDYGLWPAPARVEITEEAAAKADQAIRAELKERGLAGDLGRAALEAVPFLQPQPVDRPLLDREAIENAIATKAMYYDSGTAAVMELARPMPTRAELMDAMHTAPMVTRCYCGLDGAPVETLKHLGHLADAVLALLGGVDESGKS